ncbi:hypothetical protein AVEN_34472-1 [Araneus ventricosus]|uniref:Uncharacterized protein n=1 Tax=Araneus ventricosus TaxID=182803 RepID=A0A4Y2S9F3_ARAVE|nr:hypothetical protein AVEN_34472-1 [Araneus ventricosus]
MKSTAGESCFSGVACHVAAVEPDRVFSLCGCSSCAACDEELCGIRTKSILFGVDGEIGWLQKKAVVPRHVDSEQDILRGLLTLHPFMD